MKLQRLEIGEATRESEHLWMSTPKGFDPADGLWEVDEVGGTTGPVCCLAAIRQYRRVDCHLEEHV
jgi:hypothetical protein